MQTHSLGSHFKHLNESITSFFFGLFFLLNLFVCSVLHMNFFFFSKVTIIFICVCERVCRCQGLDQGSVPAWIKSRWRPWRGRKPPVPTFSCSIQPSLLYFQRQHGMCDSDSLDLYLNVLSFIRGRKRGEQKTSTISFHGVIIQVMGTGQTCRPMSGKNLQNLNDPLATIKEWIVSSIVDLNGS